MKPCELCGGETKDGDGADDTCVPMVDEMGRYRHRHLEACILELSRDRVPLTYDELSNIIEALQWYMKHTQDRDFQPLIDKLRTYHLR